jgi:bacterial/archaeal transporter family protein
MPLASNWTFWALLSAFFAASTAILAKLGLRSVDADFATLIRTAFILVILFVFVLATGKWQDPRQLPFGAWGLLLASGLATGASWVCYFRALKLGEAYQVAPVDKLSVVLVVLMAFVFLGERPAGKDWLGVGLICAGVVLLAVKR